METNGGDAYWINVDNERHNRRIKNIIISGLLGSNQHEKNGDVHQIHHQSFIDA